MSRRRRMNAVPIGVGVAVRGNNGPAGIGHVRKTVGAWIERKFKGVQVEKEAGKKEKAPARR